MGLLDLFRKKPAASAAAPVPSDKEVDAHGWDAITKAFLALYPGQDKPLHRAPLVHRMHDLSANAAAFDGVSVYDAGDSWHFVTYGLTELYGKEGRDPAVSGFGFELTFRLPRVDAMPPEWAFEFLEAIGKTVWKGAVLDAGHTLKTGPIDGRADTVQTSVLVVADPALPDPIDTPNGRMRFLLLVGVEDSWRQRVIEACDAQQSAPGWASGIVAELRAGNPDLVTPVRTLGRWGAV